MSRPYAFRRHQRERGGLVTVEFAIMAPIIFTIFFGLLEITQMNFLRNMCNDAAYQVARVAIVPGADVEAAKADAIALMNASGMAVVQVDVTETVDTVEATVTAPVDGNSWGIGRFAVGLVIEEACKMTKQIKSEAGG